MPDPVPRRVLVVRHSEAEPSSHRGDFHRELTERGREVAAELGRILRGGGANYDAVLCSSAVRAVQTMEAVSGELGLPVADAKVEEEYYECGSDGWARALAGLGPEVRGAMVIGHQPVLSSLVHQLSGEAVHLRPCAACMLRFDGEWDRMADCRTSAELTFPGVPR